MYIYGHGCRWPRSLSPVRTRWKYCTLYHRRKLSMLGYQATPSLMKLSLCIANFQNKGKKVPGRGKRRRRMPPKFRTMHEGINSYRQPPNVWKHSHHKNREKEDPSTPRKTAIQTHERTHLPPTLSSPSKKTCRSKRPRRPSAPGWKHRYTSNL